MQLSFATSGVPLESSCLLELFVRGGRGLTVCALSRFPRYFPLSTSLTSSYFLFGFSEPLILIRYFSHDFLWLSFSPNIFISPLLLYEKHKTIAKLSLCSMKEFSNRVCHLETVRIWQNSEKKTLTPTQSVLWKSTDKMITRIPSSDFLYSPTFALSITTERM